MQLTTSKEVGEPSSTTSPSPFKSLLANMKMEEDMDIEKLCQVFLYSMSTIVEKKNKLRKSAQGTLEKITNRF